MHMKGITALVLAVTFLAGCDEATEATGNIIAQYHRDGLIEQPSIAISPGLQIDDHGALAEVYGDRKCPSTFSTETTEDGCVIIGPEDDQVIVTVISGLAPENTGRNEAWPVRTIKSAEKEIWTVERQGEFPRQVIRLKRPDNSYVTPALTREPARFSAGHK